MSNQNGLKETEASLRPREYNTGESKSRQGGKLASGSIIPRAILSLFAGVGGMGTFLALDANSPKPSIVSAATTEIPRGNGKMTLVSGSEIAPTSTIDVQFLLINGATIDTARALVPGLNIAPPFDQSKYQGRFRVWAATPIGNLNCDLRDVRNGCNPEAIKNEIAITKRAGIIPHITIPLAESDDDHWGAGSATLTNPFEQPQIDNGHVLMIVPSMPRSLDLLALSHEAVGHWLLKLADARLIPNSKTNVGRGYANCTRDPAFWTRLYGIIYSQLKGCESDPEANTIADIMNRAEISGPRFAPELWPYIDSIMSRLPQNLVEPYGLVLPTPPNNAIRLQSVEDKPVYRVAGLEFTLNSQVPPGTTCIELKLMPANNILSGSPDGSGYYNILCGEKNFRSISFPKPEIGKGGYFLLPGMSYTGEMRVTTSNTFFPSPDNPNWRWNEFVNPYTGEKYIKPTSNIQIFLPPRYSDKISLVSPQPGETVGSKSTIQWINGDTDVFYYEVQASRDRNFETAPNKAIAAVYWNLVHGGETTPVNSWRVPEGYELEEGENWVRFRPRVQGDGTPVDWSQPQSFRVAKGAPNKMTALSHPIYGWEPDANFGNRVIGPSAEDMKKWGRVEDRSDSALSIVKFGSNNDVVVFNP